MKERSRCPERVRNCSCCRAKATAVPSHQEAPLFNPYEKIYMLENWIIHPTVMIPHVLFFFFSSSSFIIRFFDLSSNLLAASTLYLLPSGRNMHQNNETLSNRSPPFKFNSIRLCNEVKNIQQIILKPKN